MSVTQTGFKTFVQEGVVLDVGQTAVVAIVLQLGNVTQRVEVTGEAPQLQTTTTTLSTAASGVEVESLPLFGQGEMRNPAFFMILDSSTSGRGVSSGGQGTFTERTETTTVAGSQSGATEFDVDGSRMVVASYYSAAYQFIGFPQDAVSEFTMTTIAPPADIGRTGGGLLSFNLKSGSNRFHGSGFDYLRNDRLDSNGFFANEGPQACNNNTTACPTPLQQNEFGGTFGGPILKNKLFFFGWYDGFRLKQGSASSFTSTPTQAEKQGDFSAWAAPTALCPVCGNIYDPNTNAPDGSGGITRTQFMNGGTANVIPTSRFDSVASAILPYFPNPTNSNLVNNYLIAGGNGTSINEEGIKIDYELNTRNKLMGSFSESRASAFSNGSNPYPPPMSESGPSLTNIPEFRLSWDMIITPTIVNHLQYGFNRFANVGELQDTVPGGWPAKLGWKGVGTGYGEFPILNFEQTLPQSGGGGGNIPGGTFDNGTDITEALTWSKGKHTFKFGMQYERAGSNATYYGRGSGFLDLSATETGLPDSPGFAANTTGNSFASFLIGAVDSGEVYTYNAEDYERWGYYAGYAQDDYKVTSRLTLNLGVRYDLNRPVVWARNQGDWMNAALPNPDAGGLKGVYQFANSITRTPLSTYKSAFGPRIGLAFKLNDKTVIRTSYSMIYGAGGYTRANNDCCSTDFLIGFNNVEGSLNNSTGGVTPFFQLQNGWPLTAGSFTPTPGLDIGAFAERLDPANDSKPYYLENMGFQVQRDLGWNTLLSVGWVGNVGVHLPSEVDPSNEMPPQYLAYGNLPGLNGSGSALLSPVGDANAQALAPIAAMPVDPATGNHSPFPGFEKAFGGGATLGQALKIFPQYSSIIRQYETAGTSTYHALVITANKRFSNGLNFLISYTWSKTLSDADSEFSQFSGFDQDSFNAHNQKSVSLNDYPNNLVISYSYQLPFGRGKAFANQGGVVDALVGGWKISGIQQYQGGPPQEIEGGPSFSGLEGNNNNGDSWFRPNYNGGQILSAAARSGHFDPNVDSMLNAAPFSINPQWTFGNGQQIYSNARRFPYLDEDISLSKTTNIAEGVKVEIRADFLNIFNRTVIGLGSGGDLYGSTLFNNVVGSTAFGQVKSQSNVPREIQFGLKISF